MSVVCGGCVKAIESKPMMCASCKSINYCSKECQKSHWKFHKAPCKGGDAAKWKAFLDEKSKSDGVVKLPSGLMYKVLTNSTNPAAESPAVDQKCDCHYAGTLIDGREFDSSYKRGKPSTFAPNQVIKGWTEALQLMKEGDKWELYIPAYLAYGDRPRAGGIITPGAVLVFTLDLVKVLPDPKKVGKAWLAEKAKEDGVVVLKSGLQYKVLEASSKAGAKTPLENSPCECHYKGTLIDGTEFDSSYGRGAPTTFAPNQVIGGWTEAMQLMKEGDKWELYIPSDLAYGDRGSPPDIPGGSTLVFTLELLKVKGGSK